MSHFNNVNIEEVCRACFEQCDEYKILFEESEMFHKLTLGDVFTQVVKIEVKPGLVNSPTKLCLNCVKDLTAAYNFIKKSQQNNEHFLEYIKYGSIKHTDCLSEFPIDIPNDANIDFPEIKVENEVLNDYSETFSENKISTSDRYDSTASEYDEPLSNKKKKTQKLECTFCGRTYKRLDFLESHKRKHEEEIKRKEDIADDSVSPVCNECGLSCSSNIELQVHMAKEHKESSEAEDKRKTRSQRTKMNTRSQSKTQKTSSGRFECDSCSKTFAWKKDLYRHERYHEPNIKKFPCPHCDRRFIRKDKLSSHLQVHLAVQNKANTLKSFQYFAFNLFSEKKFMEIKCMICNSESFSNVRELRQHIVEHLSDLESEESEDLTNSLAVERFFPNMDLKDVLPILKKEIEQKEFGKFHSIVNGNSFEMGISDSDESDPDNMKRYKCEVCTESFNRKHKLMLHQAYDHSFDECPYECKTCELKFTCKEIFESHRKHHCGNPDREFHCKYCPGRFTWPENIKKHKCRKKYVTHKNKKKCNVCDKAFTCSRDLDLHAKTHIPESYDCSACGEKFRRYESLRFHMNSHKDDKLLALKKISCMLCNAELSTIKSLKTHLFQHADGQTEVDLKNCRFAHVFGPDADETKISETIRKCFEDQRLGELYVGINKFGLEMTLSDSDSEDDVQLNNDDVKIFTCEVCNVKFTQMQSILEHQHVEHDDLSINAPYTCDNCDDKFICKELLKRHSIVGCLSLDQFSCSKCDCKFVYKHNLAAHNCISSEKTSEDAKQCEVCGKKFNWLKDLHRHRRSHVPDERKFECLICERKFNRKDNMRAHMKVHNVDYKMRSKTMLKWDQQDENVCKPHGEKIIQCKICLSIHNSIRDLTTHLMTHKDCNTLKQKDSEVREISMVLYNKPMDLRTLAKAICKDLTNGKHSHFYSITNEVGYELSLIDSETATDLDADDEDDNDNDKSKGYTCMLCSKSFNRKFKAFEHQKQDHTWTELPLECTFCSAKFVCQRIYDLHLKNECENGEKQYKCKLCPLKFIWKENLKNHEKYMHDKNLVFPKKHHCGICDRSFLWHKGLLRHTKCHLKEEKFECTWCFRIFMRRDNLKVHMKVHKNATHLLLPDIYYLARPNSTKVAECKHCNQKYTTVKELLQHIRSAHLSFEQQETVPDPASYSITNALGYEMDIEDSETEREEPNDKYSCELCQARFNRRFKLLQHQQSLHYSDNIPHKCDQCDFKCVSEDVLAYHMRTQCMNDLKQFRCSKCTMRFMWRENLENHESVIHDSPRTYTCEICKRDFVTQHDLKNHSDCKPPEEVKLFECDVCDRKYNRKDRLTKHIKVHNEKYKEQRKKTAASTDKKFLCAFCGKEVSSSSNLVIHMRRHTGEKPFKCEFCNKGFPRSSDLNCHRRTHTGEKPHKCSECDKAFSRSYKLQTHMRIHSGERPYKCTYCEKRFTQSNDLTLHVRRHTGERPYVCETCGERFIQGTALKNHQRMRGHYPV